MSSVRQQITIQAPIRAVWRALTTEEGLIRWWCDDARLDVREGGILVLGHDTEEGRIKKRGIFHSVQATRHVEITFDTAGKALTKGTRLQFQLGRDGGEVKVHIVHGGSAFEEEEARAEQEEIWKRRLVKLRDDLEARAEA